MTYPFLIDWDFESIVICQRLYSLQAAAWPFSCRRSRYSSLGLRNCPILVRHLQNLVHGRGSVLVARDSPTHRKQGRCLRFAAVPLVLTDALHASDLLPKMRIHFGTILLLLMRRRINENMGWTEFQTNSFQITPFAISPRILGQRAACPLLFAGTAIIKQKSPRFIWCSSLQPKELRPAAGPQ